MVQPRNPWKLVEAAGTVAWLVSILGGAAVSLAATVYGALSGLPKLAQVLAALALFVLASLAIFFVIERGIRLLRRVRGKQRAESLPDKIEELIREGIDLLREGRKPMQPTKTEGGISYGLGPDMAMADQADDFYQRAWKLLYTYQPSLLFDFTETINVTRKKLRERWQAKQKELPDGGDQLHLFAEMLHQEPA